jgi:hypothetical protein
MITTGTLLIVGAGASFPYGFPTGKGLRDEIIGYRGKEEGLNGNTGQFLFREPELSAFCDGFRESLIDSIDKYLSFHPEFEKIGKLLISYVIKQKEIDTFSEFGKREGRNEIVKRLTDDEWLRFLFNRMVETINDFNIAESINNNTIKIITFNYDRIIEYSFVRAYQESFSQNKAVKRFANELPNYQSLFPLINIEHVYGSLGDFQKNKFNHKKHDLIENYYEEIKLIGQRNERISYYRELISNTKRVFFLGYGFDENNNQLLDLRGTLRGKEVYATCFGLHDEEIDRIRGKLGRIANDGNYLINCTCLDLLRKYL